MYNAQARAPLPHSWRRQSAGTFCFQLALQYSVSLAIDSRHETANMHVVKVENANATDG